MNIESDILRKFNYEDIIKDFTTIKEKKDNWSSIYRPNGGI